MFPPSVNLDNIDWSTMRLQIDFPVQVLLTKKCIIWYNIASNVVGFCNLKYFHYLKNILYGSYQNFDGLLVLEIVKRDLSN
ncbi:putative sulfite oxidase [Helianthus anomalus]